MTALDSHPPGSLPGSASTRSLFEQFAAAGDQYVREELVRRFMPLATQLARRYAGTGEPIEDLKQVAFLALVKAVDRYDPNRGTAFSSFAVPTILGELKRHFRDLGWAVHVPRALQDLTLRLRAEVDVLSRELGRPPTAGELAEAMDEPVEAIIEALETATAQRAVSLDAPNGSSDPGDRDLTRYDRVGMEEEGYERAEWRGFLRPGIECLPRRDRILLGLRFHEELTQSQIAERMGLSQMHVSRLLRRALDRLRILADRD
jgi:RNA polymerase sigma-B factor